MRDMLRDNYRRILARRRSGARGGLSICTRNVLRRAWVTIVIFILHSNETNTAVNQPRHLATLLLQQRVQRYHFYSINDN